MSHWILWEFRVRAEHVKAFEDTYGPFGAWAELFRKSPDYHGTELLRDTADTERYVTIDRWTSASAFNVFRREQAAAYEALDARCGAWTKLEVQLGTFVVNDAADTPLDGTS